MRQPFVAANWKMHGSKAAVNARLRTLLADSENLTDIELAIFPPFVFLAQTEEILASSPIAWGGQNVSAFVEGAYTGEISANMLVDFGCRYVLIGHSERRLLFKEDNATIAAKFVQANEAGLMPTFCVGESKEQRQQGQTQAVIAEQLSSILALPNAVEWLKHTIIAYEPVWAIGTGETATPEQAQAVHAYIRQLIAKLNVDIAQRLRIIYGGGIKAANAKALFAMPDIDGGLVGGASLNVQEFIQIAESAEVNN